jgi:hypothetical protein
LFGAHPLTACPDADYKEWKYSGGTVPKGRKEQYFQALKQRSAEPEDSAGTSASHAFQGPASKEKDVDKISRRLDLGNKAIKYTRDKLPFGAGNVRAQIEASNGWSGQLASEAGGLARKMVKSSYIGTYDLPMASKETLETRASLPAEWKAQDAERQLRINYGACRAISAKWHGAGVCDDFAAVTFFFLQKQKDAEDKFYRVTVSLNDDKSLSHAVVIIADPGLNEEEIMASPTAVVADPWPTSPFAVLVSDWKYAKSTVKIQWSSADMGQDYIKKVREVWKTAYTFEGNQTFRTIPDTEQEPSWKPLPYEGAKEQAMKKRQQPPNQEPNPWASNLWDDNDSWNEPHATGSPASLGPPAGKPPGD